MGFLLAQMFLLFFLPLSLKAAITTSHFTSYKIKAFEQDQSRKTSNKESIAECGASCIFDLCNVFLFDKASRLCTTTYLDMVKLDNQGIQAYVDDLTKPVGSCSETHPFAYQDGDRCCATRVAGVEEDLWNPLEIFLELKSLTCFGDSDVACPAETGICLNYDVNDREGCEVTGLHFRPTSWNPVDVIKGMGGRCGANDMEKRFEVTSELLSIYECRMRCLATVGCVGFNLNHAECVLKEGTLEFDTCDTPDPEWDMYKLLVTRNVALDDLIPAEGLTLISGKIIVVEDESKQSSTNVGNTSECVQKCEESHDCVAFSVTNNWNPNACRMFTEVTRIYDNREGWSSRVLGCDIGLDFQVPCYLLQQEAKLTGPANIKDQYYVNYWVADDKITDVSGCKSKCLATGISYPEELHTSKVFANQMCTAYTFQQGGGYKSCSLMFGAVEVDSADGNASSGMAKCPFAWGHY